MKRFTRTFTLALMGTALYFTPPPSPAQAKDADLPVSRIVLSTSGMAHFEHEGTVDGDVSISLPARLDQVDDLLKSLMVFDAKGRLGGISLPGKAPLQQTFRDLPFSQADINNPVALLNALQGAEVSISGPTRASGKIVRVVPEYKTLENGQQIIRNHRLTLMTDGGLKQVVLEDLDNVTFEDKAVRNQIDRALSALRENAARDRRTLSIDLKGEGKRDVGLAYVVEAPLWKAAYRLVLPTTEEDKGFVQGWAVIENITGNDWNDVELTLVSGNPVTFSQPLYESYFVKRPEIPVEVLGRVLPRVDSGTLTTASDAEREYDEARLEKQMDGNYARRSKSVVGRAMSAPAAAPMEMASDMAYGGGMMAMEESIMPAKQQIARGATASVSEEAATQVLFRFKDSFDLTAGHSMMLPFVSQELPMERVWLYQPDTHPSHPLASIRMKNNSESGLPPGIITLYEPNKTTGGTSFVGDAQLPVLTKGEDRLISYALDSKTQIDKKAKSEQVRGTITVSQGVMKTKIRYLNETTYTLKAPPEESRTVLIEHPRMHDYEIIKPEPKSVEVTKTHYRVKVPLKPGESKTVPVVLERHGWESISILNMSTHQLKSYATTHGKLDANARKAFATMAQMRAQIDELEQNIRTLDQKRSSIYSDQNRLRDNLRSVPSNSDLSRRYLKSLDEQEDMLEDIAEARAKLDQQKNAKYAELRNFINRVKF